MGWRRTGDGDDRISDEGADCLLATLRQLSDRSVEARGVKPDLTEILVTAATALWQRPEALVGDPGSLPNRPAVLAMQMREGPAMLVPLDADAPDPFAVGRMYDAFDDAASDYLGSELARLPHLSELLALLAFVLRVEAIPLIDGVADELPIDRIVLRPAGAG